MKCVLVRIKQVLAKFVSVFNMPEGSPPKRGREHQTIMKKGCDSISAQPSRCSQVNKAKVEKMVEDLLLAGTIIPSQSLYSRLILLTKNKDGSWRFCVDNRTLNKEAMANKYPILVIDEILDELHVAAIFFEIGPQIKISSNKSLLARRPQDKILHSRRAL